jgi:hypothetical protein
MRYLITSGCSFSHHWGHESSPLNWIEVLENKLRDKHPNLIALHVGYNGHGQEMIQKKVSLTIMELLEQGVMPADIFVAVMWSGTFRKSWYIDNDMVINEITKNMVHFNGGMDPMFLDLKNSHGENPKYFKTASGSEFPYNPDSGWYTTVNGSDCQMAFVQQHYMLDGFHGHGVGKVHASLENIIFLQNLCRLKGIQLINQFFMDHVYQDIEQHKDHQIINYLYKQLDNENTIKEGMFETLHELINVPRNKVYNVTHDERKQLNGNNDYFSKDGFHPGTTGSEYWCNKVLFPLLQSKNIL